MECHNCGNEYERIATHWSASDCSYPEFSDHQMDILTGVLMGDGTVDNRFHDTRNPRFRIDMTNKEYLEYLYEEFGDLCTRPPTITRTSEEAVQHGSTFTNSTDPADYKDMYRLEIISHPSLERFADWYKTGEKVFPEDLNMNKTILKHWYVCDGSYDKINHNNSISIHLSNERENKEKIESYFEDIGHSVSRWTDYQLDNGRYRTSIIFNSDETDQLLEYMGEPLPGFDYTF